MLKSISGSMGGGAVPELKSNGSGPDGRGIRSQASREESGPKPAVGVATAVANKSP